MNQTVPWILIFCLTLTGCGDKNSSAIQTSNEAKYASNSESSSDIIEIETVIREALNWANSKNSINLLPLLADSKDSAYIGFDLDMHRQNKAALRNTNLFATAFIDNYDQIILTLDKRQRSGQYEPWLVGELPPFNFANDADPWCMCQDVPYDKPNPWDNVKVEVIELNNTHGELVWKWGNSDQNSDPGWRAFSYRFKVVKEDSRWKISYLQGFDLNESTRKDGEL